MKQSHSEIICMEKQKAKHHSQQNLSMLQNVKHFLSDPISSGHSANVSQPGYGTAIPENAGHGRRKTFRVRSLRDVGLYTRPSNINIIKHRNYIGR